MNEAWWSAGPGWIYIAALPDVTPMAGITYGSYRKLTEKSTEIKS